METYDVATRHVIKRIDPRDFICMASYDVASLSISPYDKGRNQRITFIDRPKGSPPPGLYRPNLVWDQGKAWHINPTP
jgi:hypothetical protein